MNEELQGIIDLAIQNGYDENDIRSVLSSTQWSDTDIASAVDYYSKKKRPTQPQQSRPSQSQIQQRFQKPTTASPSTSAPVPSSSVLPRPDISAPSDRVSQQIPLGLREQDIAQERQAIAVNSRDNFIQGFYNATTEEVKTPDGKTKREPKTADKAIEALLQNREDLESQYSMMNTMMDIDNPQPLFIETTDEEGNKKQVVNNAALAAPYRSYSEETKRQKDDYQQYLDDLASQGDSWANNTFTRFGLNALATAALIPEIIQNLPATLEDMALGAIEGRYNPMGFFAPPTHARYLSQQKNELGDIGSALMSYSEQLSFAERVDDFGMERATKGIAGNLTDGTIGGFGTGIAMMGSSFIENIPQLAVAITMPEIGLPILGVMSGTNTFNRVRDENYSIGDKMTYAVAVGTAEYLSEKVFSSDISAAAEWAAKNGVKLGTKESKAALGDAMFGWMPKALRQPMEEGFEEVIVAIVDEGFAASLEGRPMNLEELAEAGLAGFGAGGGIHVATKGFSALGKLSALQTKYEIQNNITNINNVINDPTISESEKIILQRKLTEYQRQKAQIEKDAFAFYSNMSEEDVKETIKLNQTIKNALVEYQAMKTDEGRAEVAAKVKESVAQKQAIENKYDSKTQQQVSGVVQEGQAAEQTKPVTEAGEGQTQAGGDVQTLEEVESGENLLFEGQSLRDDGDFSDSYAGTTGLSAILDKALYSLNPSKSNLSRLNWIRKYLDPNYVSYGFERSSLSMSERMSYDIMDNNFNLKYEDYGKFVEGLKKLGVEDVDAFINEAIKESNPAFYENRISNLRQKRQSTNQQAEQEVQEVTKSVLQKPKYRLKNIKITKENVGQSLQFLRDAVGQMSDLVFEATQTSRESVGYAINSIENVVNSLVESGQDVEVVAHQDAKSFQKATGEENSARALHITTENGKNQIHILVPAATSNTVYHEAIHELIGKVMGVEGVSKLAKKLRKVMKSDALLDSYMQAFEAQYGKEAKDSEFLTELGSLIADGTVDINVKRGVAAKFIEAVSDVLGKVFNIQPTNPQLLDALNYLTNQLATGQAVETQDTVRYQEVRPTDDPEAEPGDVMSSGVSTADDIKQATTFSPLSWDFNAYSEMNGANLVFPKSQTDMKSALEKSGGAWVIINSDGTGVGTTDGGVELYGGIGFSFIEQNIKDEIGFAASSDNKITELGAKIARTAKSRDAFYPEHAGKPVAVFVMVQTPGAAFGNHYGAKFFADALMSVVEGGILTQEQVKEQFSEYVDSKISLAEGRAESNEKNREKEMGLINKLKLIRDAVNEADLTTKKGHDSIQKLVESDNKIDFGTRRKFLEEFIPNTNKTRGPGGELRNALLKSKFNLPSFIDTYLDKNITPYIADNTKDGGYIVSGFYVENPTDAQGFVAKSKSGKFKHPQFNSQFHGTDPFLLNGKYYVNEIFEPQQYKAAKTGKGVPVAASVAGSMYVSSEYIPGEGVRFRDEDMYLEGLKQIEKRIAEASKSKVQFQKIETPDFANRYKDVKTSKVNTYGVSTSIFTDILNTLNDPNGAVQLLDKKEMYMPVPKQADGDKDKSNYMAFTAVSKKLRKKIKIEIRVADHTVPKSETVRSKEFNEEGYYRRSDRKDPVLSVALNIWDKASYLEVKTKLEMYGFKINKVNPEYFNYNRRLFREQKFHLYNKLVDLLNKYTTPNEDGTNSIGIDIDEFVRIAEMLGMSSQDAKQMYSDQVLDKLGYETNETEFSDSLYKDSLDKERELKRQELTLWQRLKKYFTDRQATVKAKISEAGLANAKDLLVNRSGAAAFARYLFDKWDSKIYGGLDLKQQQVLDMIVFLRRVIQIDESFDQRRSAAEAELASAKAELAEWTMNNLDDTSTATKKKEAEYRKAIEELEDRAASIVRPKHPRSRKFEKIELNKESATKELRRWEKKLGKTEYDLLFDRSTEYFDAFRSLLDEMYDEGLVTQDSYDAIKDFNYQPRQFLVHVFDNASDDVAVRDYGLSQKQIKAIKEGSEGQALMDSRFILSLYARSVTSRIAKNKANRALAEGLKDRKNYDWIKPESDGPAENNFEHIYYYDKGEQKRFQLRKDLKQEWDDLGGMLNPNISKVVSYASGSFVLKLLATRANPTFVLRNFPRDYAHILFFTKAYDNHNLFFAGMLLFRDFFTGLKSKVTDDQYYQDYMRLGGGMDFLSTEGRRSSVAQSRGEKIQESILKTTSGIGEASEIGFRIAVYKKLVDEGIKDYKTEKGMMPRDADLERIKINAVTQAREIIDFAQGGLFTKGAEVVTPYLNSAFQGMRVSYDYMKANPARFSRKLGEMTLGITALALYNFTLGGDDMDDIPDETKKRYHIVFTPFTYVDEKGRTRRRYVKIAKTQQMAPFYALSEAIAANTISKLSGKEYRISDNEIDYIISGAMSFLPKDPTRGSKELLSAIPVYAAFSAYESNYDLFREQMISLDKGKVLPQDEGLFDKNVPYFYKAIGAATGMSPKRMQVATEKVITSPYSSMVVGMSYALLNESARLMWEPNVSYSDKESLKRSETYMKDTWDGILRAGQIGSTSPDWKMYNKAEEIDKINQESGSRRADLKNSAFTYADKYKTAKTEAERRKVLDESGVKLRAIASENRTDADYFRATFQTAAKIQNIPQDINEIKWATDHIARAKIMRMILEERGGTSRQDIINLRKEMAQAGGRSYDIPAQTIREYIKLYGNPN